jgi:hypothetical protein
MQAMLGYHSEARWLRHARKHLGQQDAFSPSTTGTAVITTSA